MQIIIHRRPLLLDPDPAFADRFWPDSSFVSFAIGSRPKLGLGGCQYFQPQLVHGKTNYCTGL